MPRELRVEQAWTDVDDYIVGQLLPEAADFDFAIQASQTAGLPPIAVTAPQGKLLELLVRVHGARRILELGTLGGYSTLWLARALPPGGQIVTLESEPRHAEVARANIDRAGYSDAVEIRVGPALDTLLQLAAENAGPFDLIFIDADKENYPGYFDWSLKLSHPGTVIVGDNVVRDGAILRPDAPDPITGATGLIPGVRRFYELLADATAAGRVSATAIQTVGAKGYDGFVLAIVAS